MADPVSLVTVAVASLGTAGTIAVTVGAAVIATKVAQALGPRQSDIQTGGGVEAARTVTVQSTNEPRRLVYGKPPQFAGHVVFFNTSTGGSGQILRYLWYVVRWCDHPIDGYVSWYIDGDKIEPGDINVSNEVTLARFTDSDGNRLVKMWSFDGTQTTALTDLINDFSELDSTFVGRDVAYTAFRFEIDESDGGDPNSPTERVWAKGVPRNFEVELRGLELEDTRISTTQFSDNNILGLRHYLLDSRYGMNLASSKIPTGYVNSSSDICDQLVTIWDGAGGTTTQKRYTANGIITTDMTHGEVIEQFRDACAGEVFFQQGQLILLAGSYRTPTDTLTEEDLDLQFKSKVLEGDNRYNAVQGLFFDASRNGQFVEFLPRQDTSYQADDKEVIWKDLELPMTVDNQAAQRLALIALKRSRRMLSFSALCKQRAVRFGVGDVVNVSISYMGWSSVPFTIVEMAFQPDGVMQAVFREEIADSYDYIAPPSGSAEIDEPGSAPTPITGNSDPQPTTSLASTTTLSGPRLNWTNPNEENEFKIEVWRSDDNDRANATRQVSVNSERFLDENTVPGKLYYYWTIVRSVRSNLTSTWEPAGATSGILGVRSADAGLILDPTFDATEPQELEDTSSSTFWEFLGTRDAHIIASAGVENSNVLRLFQDQGGGVLDKTGVRHLHVFPFASGKIRFDVRYKSTSATATMTLKAIGYSDSDRSLGGDIGQVSSALVDTAGSFVNLSLTADISTPLLDRNWADIDILMEWSGGSGNTVDIDFVQAFYVN